MVVHTFCFFVMAWKPRWIWASYVRFHDHTQTHHTRWDSSGRVISPMQRPLPDQHNTNKRQTGIPWRDSNPYSQQAIGRRPTPLTVRRLDLTFVWCTIGVSWSNLKCSQFTNLIGFVLAYGIERSASELPWCNSDRRVTQPANIICSVMKWQREVAWLSHIAGILEARHVRLACRIHFSALWTVYCMYVRISLQLYQMRWPTFVSRKKQLETSRKRLSDWCGSKDTPVTDTFYHSTQIWHSSSSVLSLSHKLLAHVPTELMFLF
jgi:hypothetical protein